MRRYFALRIKTAALLIFSIGVILLVSTGWAETVHLARRLQCMACHAGPDRFVTDPETGEVRNVTIEMGDFHEGDHGDMHCLECHKEGFDQFPHIHMKTYTCMDCHPREEEGAEDDEPYDFDRILKEFEDTVHFTEYEHEKEKCCGTAPEDSVSARQNNKDQEDKQRFTCEHCHNPHYFKATAHIKKAQLILENDNGPCIRCHKDDATGALADPAEPSMILAHAYLPLVDLHLRTTRCIDCHTNVKKTVAHDLPEGKDADQGCNTCHSINTILIDRLYRYHDDPERTLGFRNAMMLPDSYIMGAHRHRWIDWASYILVGLSILFISVHGGLRIFYRWRRSGKAPIKDHSAGYTSRSGDAT